MIVVRGKKGFFRYGICPFFKRFFRKRIAKLQTLYYNNYIVVGMTIFFCVVLAAVLREANYEAHFSDCAGQCWHW